ncbi:MAG: ferrous iron transport protein A [Candidatus Omnitrophota bacterium]|nr:MAG: ferrous iron transport protein A [Candidatus Omnitrophota bacterium]
MIVNLIQMQSRQKGIVVEIRGGQGMANKLCNMGLRPGKEITKVSSQIWGGPQTIEVDNTQIAIGYGMAQRIFVEVKE